LIENIKISDKITLNYTCISKIEIKFTGLKCRISVIVKLFDKLSHKGTNQSFDKYG